MEVGYGAISKPSDKMRWRRRSIPVLPCLRESDAAHDVAGADLGGGVGADEQKRMVGTSLPN